MQYPSKLFTIILLALSLVALNACFKNPVTGRKSLNLVSEGEMRQMANQQYLSFINTNKTLSGTKDAEMVQRVGSRMASAVNDYLVLRGQQGLILGYNWEFNIVNSPEVNAWCMPGGKVVVYTGLMPVAQNEAGLAVVMGHEIAHAVARHANERMSQQLAVQFGGEVLSAAASTQPAQTAALFNQVIGVGSTLGVLAFSRQQETEADDMGLIFMAMAGYNPNEAVPFWQRMAAAGGAKPPEFLSTHPSDDTRIKNIQAKIPEAMKYYKPH